MYQNSYELAKEMYKIANQLPREETFGLVSQIKRASTSIALNIAEGYGKGVYGKELVRFLTMARGSCAEIEVLLNFCKDFGYITKDECERYENEYEIVGRMLTSLIKKVEEQTRN